jgi:arsenite methyltransferase
MEGKIIIKDDIKKQYAKIALSGSNSESCCMPDECGCSSSSSSISPPAGSLTTSRNQAAAAIGYDQRDLQSVPKESILGVGCGHG